MQDQSGISMAMKSSGASVKPVKGALPGKPGTAPLTVEQFRSFDGCAHYSEEEAAAIIEALSKLAGILIRTANPEKSSS